jgi:4-amino-4-deoxy-L-arabinose transferase-like glycosyltransferase
VETERPLMIGGLCAAVALSLTLNFFRLGRASIKESDEAIEALSSREMLQGGDWLTPHLNGIPRYTKPPLYFWLTAGAFRVFGTTDFALRFWSAAAGAGTVLAVGLMGWQLFGARAGAFGALALATCVRFIYYHAARTGCLDAMTAFWIAVGLLCVISRGLGNRRVVLAAVALGAASLTKNFLGLPAAALAAIFLFATPDSAHRISRRYLVAAAAIVLALSLAWPAAMWILHGREFGDAFVLRENLGRFALNGRNPLPWERPAPVSRRAYLVASTLFDGFFPWSLLAPLMMPWVAWKAPRWVKDGRAVPLLWIAFYAFGMLCTANPLPWYGCLFYPAVAVLIGAFVAGLLPNGSHGTLLTLAAVPLAAATLVFRPRWIGDQIAFLKYRGASIRLVAISAAWMAPLAFGAVVVFLLAIHPRSGRILLVAGLAAIAAFFAAAPLRPPGEVSTSKLLAERIRETSPASGNRLTIWNFPPFAPTGNFPGWWCEARWYLLEIPGVTIRNLAAEDSPAASSFSPRPALVLTRSDAAGTLPPHRVEEETVLWSVASTLAGFPEER